MPFATAPDGAKIYFESTGSGEPLVLVMGVAEDHRLWNEVRGDFASRYQTIVYDYRGTGQSDKPKTPPYSTRGFTKDIVAILDHLKLDRAHLYGISMGGRVGQWMAIDYPERLGTVILGCTMPGGPREVKRSIELGDITSDAAWLDLFDTLVSPEWRKLNPQFAEDWLDRAKEPIPDYAEAMHYAAGREHNAWDKLSTISVPTLVIHGEKDLIAPVENAYLLHDRIPNSELALIPGGRHLYFLEFQEKSSNTVINFLERHPIKR